MIDGDRSGPQSQVVAVTISNVLEHEPVPVLAFEEPLQWLTGLPVELDATLVTGRVRRLAGR